MKEQYLVEVGNKQTAISCKKRLSFIQKVLRGDFASKEYLYNEYIVKNRRKDDLIQELHMSATQFARLLRYYQIKKDKTAYHQNSAKSQLKTRVAENSEKRQEYIDYINTLVHKPTIKDLAKHFNTSVTSIQTRLIKWNIQDMVVLWPYTSHYEKDISNLIEQNHIRVIHNKRGLLPNGYEIDLYLPELSIGIEFNGTYWHSTARLNKDYHFEKSKFAEEKGIRLIHIYEYEWNDSRKRPIIESMLKIALGVCNKKIYARECEIREISNKEAKEFNNKNHLQGHRNAQVTYGLYYNNELVQLMSFSKTKYNRNLINDNSWEIIRGCPGSNNIVVGGVSKLFKHFIKQHNPDEIFSYCDFNKFDGRGYEAIGMKFVGYTGPDMKWIMPGYQEVVDRQPSRHKELKESAVSQIWGAGSKKYKWIK